MGHDCVLVTGGAGYIGSHMVRALFDAGRHAIVIDDLSTGFESAVAPEAVFIPRDAGDSKLLGRIIRRYGVRSIIHFAAKLVVPDSMITPLQYYAANTAKTRNLIEAAVDNGVKEFVFSSTAAVYGEPVATPVGEEVPPAPVSPYGRSKLMSEWMLADAEAAHGLRFVALRYFNVAGADPLGRCGQSTVGATHLVKVAVEAALGRRGGITVFGSDYPTPDGTCVRDFIHVTDLVAAHLAALHHLHEGGGSLVLNCGYGMGYSVLDVIDSVKRVSGRDFPVTFAARRPGDPATIIAKTERIRSLLNWSPKLDDLDAIVLHALNWERRLGRGPRSARRLPTSAAGGIVSVSNENREQEAVGHPS